MNLDLTYLPAQDRLQLSIRGQASWLITRSMVLKLVSAWIQKLQSVDLPDVGIPLGLRDVEQEHALSLEFDGPQSTGEKPQPNLSTDLLTEASLTIDSVGTKLVLKGQGQMTMNLTRKESHMVLELLAQKARAAQWLEPVVWPQWLGK